MSEIPKFTIAEFKKYLETQDSLGDIHYNLSAENIRKANQPYEEELDERDYHFGIDPYDDIFTVEDWNEAVFDGVFTNTDGSGYWVKDGLASRDEVFSTPQLGATHVVWYNK